MGKRNFLPQSEVFERVEAELVNEFPISYKNRKANELGKYEAHPLAYKIVDSLPAIIDLAKDIVTLRMVENQTQLEIVKLKQKNDLLRVEAESFVKKAQASRATIEVKGQQAVNILVELTNALRENDIEPDVQKELIKVYNFAIQKVCEEPVSHE